MAYRSTSWRQRAQRSGQAPTGGDRSSFIVSSSGFGSDGDSPFLFLSDRADGRRPHTPTHSVCRATCIEAGHTCRLTCQLITAATRCRRLHRHRRRRVVALVACWRRSRSPFWSRRQPMSCCSARPHRGIVSCTGGRSSSSFYLPRTPEAPATVACASSPTCVRPLQMRWALRSTRPPCTRRRSAMATLVRMHSRTPLPRRPKWCRSSGGTLRLILPIATRACWRTQHNWRPFSHGRFTQWCAAACSLPPFVQLAECALSHCHARA
jgi:hypothetical protein